MQHQLYKEKEDFFFLRSFWFLEVKLKNIFLKKRAERFVVSAWVRNRGIDTFFVVSTITCDVQDLYINVTRRLFFFFFFDKFLE